MMNRLVCSAISKMLPFGLSLCLFAAFPCFTTAAAEIIPKRIVIPNGLVLILVESDSLPLITVKMVVNAGSRFDPKDKAGLAHMTASLLDRGTAHRSAQEIDNAIDFIGGKLTIEAEKDYATLLFRLLKKDGELGFDLLSDILKNPTFQSREVDRKQKEIQAEILSEKEDPGSVAEKAFNDLLFGNHPYHDPVLGREETVKRIKRKDIVQFHKNFYKPNNTILTIVGDLSEPEAREWAEKYFGSWETGKVDFPDFEPVPPLKGRQVKVIDKNLTQANIVLGHLGIPRNHPDYHAVQVMNYILGGGGFSARLMTHIRDNQGLAYHISSRFDSLLESGSFRVVLQTKNRSANEAVSQVLEEIRRIQSDPVSDRELDESRSYLIGSFPLRLDTSYKLANFFSSVEFYGLGLDYLEQYPRRIATVSKREVSRVAKKYLSPENIILVVVADEAEANLKIPE